MRHTILLRSPKKEEEQEAIGHSFVPEFDGDLATKEADVTDELEGIFGIEDVNSFPVVNWSFTDWEGFGAVEEEEGVDREVAQMGLCFHDSRRFGNVKGENCEFWDDHDQDNKNVSLNLSLNYQEVLDAWSDRGSLFACECANSMANSGYAGEVPIMEEDRTRRDASVLRYKEKRQNRLFCKKIRYQVRKLNADNRPRIKGRFVKRVFDKIPKRC